MTQRATKHTQYGRSKSNKRHICNATLFRMCVCLFVPLLCVLLVQTDFIIIITITSIDATKGYCLYSCCCCIVCKRDERMFFGGVGRVYGHFLIACYEISGLMSVSFKFRPFLTNNSITRRQKKGKRYLFTCKFQSFCSIMSRVCSEVYHCTKLHYRAKKIQNNKLETTKF